MRRAVPGAALTGLALLGLGGAALGVASGDSAGAPRGELNVTLDEWSVATTGAVAPGTLAVRERNAGAAEHDLTIVRTDLAANRLPRGLEGVAPDQAGEVVLGSAHGHDHGDHAGSGHGHDEAHLEPGARRSRSVRLEPGRYVLLCPVPGHYERGQATAITVR